MNGDSNNPVSSEAVLKVKINGQNRRFVLVADELVTIGRASSCGIHLQDKSVSREHCVAVFTNGKIVINDLRSTHGVTHNGERVGHCELLPGDTCHLGNALAEFEPAGTKQQAKVRPAPAAAKPASEAASPAPAKAVPAAPAAPAAPAGPVTDIEAEATAINAPSASSPSQPRDRDVEAAAATEPTRAIAGYRILDTIGQGGYGTVYRAEQVQLHREVALKILKHGDDSSAHKAEIEAFLREARLAAGLRDPRLVQIYDVGESDGEHFLSMELIEGGSLARKIRRDGPMPWPEVIRMLRDIALALKVAHAAQLVHRDVKPGNILLAANGQAKLTDLGLAASGEHAGTIAFMSPEQLRRENVDARADIYALGCTAYAALTGSPPFGGDRKEMARGHLRQKPAPLLDRDVQVPYHLGQLIVDSMMAKDANDRPQSADAVIERLDRMILPTSSEPLGLDEDELDYPSVAPTRLGRPSRNGGSSKSQKAFMARLTADAIVFGLVGGTVIALLLGLKVVWDIDIYRMIGK
tara:strand:- start:1314 stop:2888 length:1575 start_codon:yes stop_codon:yes gene_type:complete